MEEKKIESREIQVPFKKQTILGFTDQKRESLRVGITQKKFELYENEITLSSLGMRGDGKWALDGKTRKVSRKEILCILRPEIENKQFIVNFFF